MISPPEFSPLHWHGDTFDLPKSAVHLMEGTVYPNQSFSYGDNTVALQFHLEFCARSVDRLCQGVGDAPKASPGIQSQADILSRKDLFVKSELLLQKFLNNLIYP